jgi:hypothetical protein
MVPMKSFLLMSVLLKLAFSGSCDSLLPKDVVIPSGWRVVTLADLPNDDRDLWQREHTGRCPGVAAGRLVSGDRYSYAVALLKEDANGGLFQQLVVWLWAGGHLSSTVLVGPTPVVAGPFVVWMAPPGKSVGVDGQPPVMFAHDSFIYEKMEAIATQFYYLNGRFRKLQTAE